MRGSSRTSNGAVIVCSPTVSRAVYVPGSTRGPSVLPPQRIMFSNFFAGMVRRSHTKRLWPFVTSVSLSSSFFSSPSSADGCFSASAPSVFTSFVLGGGGGGGGGGVPPFSSVPLTGSACTVPLYSRITLPSPPRNAIETFVPTF